MYAPAAFSQDDTTKVVVRAEEVDRDPAAATLAVDACPTGALRIIIEGSLSHGQ
jgi:ferredoxin